MARGWIVRPGGKATGQKGACMEVGARGWGGLHRVEVRGLHCGGSSAGDHGLGPLEGGESPACWAVAPWLESQPLHVACSRRRAGAPLTFKSWMLKGSSKT